MRSVVKELAALVPALTLQWVACPTPDPILVANKGKPACRPCKISVMVLHLNDVHGWSREKIADWLESIPDLDLTIKPKEKTDA